MAFTMSDNEAECEWNTQADALEAFQWVRANSHRFSGNIHGPMFLELEVRSMNAGKYVEKLVPERDLLAFVCETAPDMTQFLETVRASTQLRINVVCGYKTDVPARERFQPTYPLNEIREYGFSDYLINQVVAPEAVLGYLCHTYGFHNIPIGNNEIDAPTEPIPLPADFPMFFLGDSFYKTVDSEVTVESLHGPNLITVTQSNDSVSFACSNNSEKRVPPNEGGSACSRIVAQDGSYDTLVDTLVEEGKTSYIPNTSGECMCDFPLRVLFMPGQFGRTFNERSISFSTDMFHFAKLIRMNALIPSEEESHAIFKYSTVASDSVLVHSLMPFLVSALRSSRYRPQWIHVQEILHNLGFDEEPREFVSNLYYSLDTPCGVLQESHFRVVIMMIRYGFTKWDHESLLPLITFLCDCLFEVSVLGLQSEILILLSEVAAVVMNRGLQVDDLVDLINQSHISTMCNAQLVLQLSSVASLRLTSFRLGLHTAFKLLSTGPHHQHSFNSLVTAVSNFQTSGKFLNCRDVIQLAAICETLACRYLSDDERKGFLRHLLGFVAQQIASQRLLADDCSVALMKSRLQLSHSLSSLTDEQTLTHSSPLCGAQLDDNYGASMFQCFQLVFECGVRPNCKSCSQPHKEVDRARVISSHLAKLIKGRLNAALFSCAIHDMTIYAAQEVLITSSIVNFLLTNLCKIPDMQTVLSAKSFLGRHMWLHPPCRAGMREYYKELVQCAHSTNCGKAGHCYTFVSFIQQVVLYLNKGTCDIMPLGTSEPCPATAGCGLHSLTVNSLQTKVKVINSLMFAFNYFVEILYHDFHSCSHTANSPLLVTSVLGNVSDVNLHCADIAHMYVTVPRAWRDTVGRYLALLYVALKKPPQSPTFIFFPIPRSSTPCNSLVHYLISAILNGNDLNHTSQLMSDIPSNFFRCQLLQAALFRQLTNVENQSTVPVAVPSNVHNATATHKRELFDTCIPLSSKRVKCDTSVATSTIGNRARSRKARVHSSHSTPPLPENPISSTTVTQTLFYKQVHDNLVSGSWLTSDVVEVAIEKLMFKYNKHDSITFLQATYFDKYQHVQHRLVNGSYECLVSALDIERALNKEFIIALLHVRQNHWIIGVVVFRTKHILILDSLSPNNCAHQLVVAKFMLRVAYTCYLVGGIAFNESEWVTRPYKPCFKQNNSTDCGLFAVYNATLFFDVDGSVGQELWRTSQTKNASEERRRKLWDLIANTLRPLEDLNSRFASQTLTEAERSRLIQKINDYEPKLETTCTGTYSMPVPSATIWKSVPSDVGDVVCGALGTCKVNADSGVLCKGGSVCVRCRVYWHQTCQQQRDCHMNRGTYLVCPPCTRFM